jgi:hypothetical protein
MMSNRMALRIAIDLLHSPSRVRLTRTEPLPDDVLTLLRIVAGDQDAEIAAALTVDRSRDIVRQAATFFIEQILFAPDCDSYRILGVSSQAGAPELRRHVALLLRWLHPDLDPHDDRSIFIGRVTAAWNDVKTVERRAAYDDRLQLSEHVKSSRSRSGKSRSSGNDNRKPSSNGKRHRIRFGRKPGNRNASAEIGFFRRALSILLQRPPQ